jgi:hypothetical protein
MSRVHTHPHEHAPECICVYVRQCMGSCIYVKAGLVTLWVAFNIYKDTCVHVGLKITWIAYQLLPLSATVEVLPGALAKPTIPCRSFFMLTCPQHKDSFLTSFRAVVTDPTPTK